jgi:hypothetical protein
MNKLILSISALFPTIALAHEEHGPTLMENLWHVFTNLEHVWPLTIAVVLVGVVAWVEVRS